MGLVVGACSEAKTVSGVGAEEAAEIFFVSGVGFGVFLIADAAVD